MIFVYRSPSVQDVHLVLEDEVTPTPAGEIHVISLGVFDRHEGVSIELTPEAIRQLAIALIKTLGGNNQCP